MLEKIQNSLKQFSHGNLSENALNLFQTLGYESSRQQPFDDKSFANFAEYVTDESKFNRKNAFADEWQYVDLLFQLTETELTNQLKFDGNKFDKSQFNSYLFFAVELNETKSDGKKFTRTDLANITREINKCFPMPVFVLFKLGNNLTLSVINRRVHKKDETKDVIEIKKISLIKDIDFTDPKRSHLEILKDLSIEQLRKNPKFEISNFVGLHKAWMATLDTKELNKRFFRELSNWYFWAVQKVKFPKAPNDTDSDEIHSAKSVIRLITRLMFVWFLKEKGLISAEIFSLRELKNILKFEDDSAYYKAILQNLFFATLNTDDTDKRTPRKFRSESENSWYKSNQGVANVYRYKSAFINPEETLEKYFLNVPFLNGGLFECLDKPEEKIWIDGFSERKDNPLDIPDDLFFGELHEVDLNAVYDTKNKKYEVRGLINILDNYKFTIAENTPIEEEIALDPELLGKVFENLLANYNPETKTTARKQTGSFYTPREIVNYMVDESLIAYLKTKLQTETQGFSGFLAFGENQPTMFGNDARIQPKFEIPISENRWLGKDEELENALRQLFSYSETENQFNEIETEILIKAINDCKILDPACGSGAFPMGILQRLVFLLGKLDPNNVKWRELQRQVAVNETDEAFKIGDVKERENRLLEINEVFENNASDYGRKLFLIENCIYGVDIQPVAIQISKLRFFISLIIDQKIDDSRPNRGVRPLPNLETKLVAANTLIGLDAQRGLKPEKVHELEESLKPVRSEIFRARTTSTKTKWRERDKEIRREIAELLKHSIDPDDADKIADWSPDNQDAHADWFDAEWMFGIEKGFDIVIGNPPYGVNFNKTDGDLYSKKYSVFNLRGESYVLFIERAFQIMNETSFFSFIIPDTLLNLGFTEATRLFLLKNTKLKELDLLPSSVFGATVVDTILLFFQKDKQNKTPKSDVVVKLFDKKSTKMSLEFPEKSFTISTDIWLNQKTFNVQSDKTESSLISKIDINFPTLETFSTMFSGIKSYEVGKGKPPQTEETRRTKPFTSKTQLNEQWFPLFDGKHIGYYELLWKENNWINYGEWLAAPRHAENFKDEKLLIRKIIGKTLIATYIPYTSYCNTLLFVLKLLPNAVISYKPLLGILNSNFIGWYFRKKFQISDEDTFPQIMIRDILQFHIPNVSNSKTQQIAEIVDKILTLKKADNRADTLELEREIDRLVYGLYELTADEIAIVEGKT